MGTRGRKSAAELLTSKVRAQRPRVVAPEHLTDEEKEFFVELVDSTIPEHFVTSDVPLLASYCQTTLLARKAAKRASQSPEDVPVFERLVKLQATLATRLRLAPQARLDPKTLGRAATNMPRRDPPWL